MIDENNQQSDFIKNPGKLFQILTEDPWILKSYTKQLHLLYLIIFNWFVTMFDVINLSFFILLLLFFSLFCLIIR